MKKTLHLATLFLLCACTTGAASVEVAYSSAATGALAYVQLPACEKTTAQLCSQADIVRKIKVASDAAYKAVLFARAAHTAEADEKARSLVEEFQAIIAYTESHTKGGV